MNYGFNPRDVKIDPLDWKFGSMSDRTVLEIEGQWDNYLPVFEHQADKYETYGCTVWGSLNQVETYLNRVFDFQPNYSDRYNYNIVGINPPGSNPHKALESIRKQGVIEESVLPYPDTLGEFITPRPMSEKYLSMGQKWGYELVHEWVISRDQSKMKGKIIDALKYSPVAIGVTAWYLEDGVYIDKGEDNTHWTLCYGYHVLEDGTYLKVFDSYDNSIKTLHKDHFISLAKRIYIRQRTKEMSFIERLCNLFRQ